MDQKSRIIVLKTIKYSDSKLIVDFLSREEGRVSALWKIASSRNAKVKRQFFQPLTILEADLTRSPLQQLAQIKDARLAHPYSSLPFDGAKLSLGFFIAEFLIYATRDVRVEPLLYDFIENNLIWLDSTDRGIVNFHLMFMMRIIRFLGFQPDTDAYSENAFFDLREGCFSPYAPLHKDFLKPEEAQLMMLLMRMTPSNIHLFKLTRAERNRITDLCLHFCRLHIPQFGEMKALQVLREL